MLFGWVYCHILFSKNNQEFIVQVIHRLHHRGENCCSKTKQKSLRTFYPKQPTEQIVAKAAVLVQYQDLNKVFNS